jgi:GT2 family glycosyltransferase
MSKPLVSVVMVTRNVERFLAEAIESILGQTFEDFEFIILDFGSTDSSKAIAASYGAKDSRIKLHEVASCGLTEARNASCRVAQGKYIAIMDADDVSLPNRLASQVDFMEEHPQVGLLGALADCMNSEGKSLGFRVHLNPPTDDEKIRLALREQSPFCQPTIMLRREAFEVVEGYRPVLAQAEDYDLFVRIAERFCCAGLEQVVLNYRIHPHQLSMHKQRQQSLCMLAAQASAAARRNGKPDPLDSVKEITPKVVEYLGISMAAQRSSLVQEWETWIRFLCMAGEEHAALSAALEVLGSDLRYVERRRVSDLHLTVAWLYWREKKRSRSILSAGRAVAMRPQVVGRPLKALLRRMGMA